MFYIQEEKTKLPFDGTDCLIRIAWPCRSRVFLFWSESVKPLVVAVSCVSVLPAGSVCVLIWIGVFVIVTVGLWFWI